MGAVLIVDDNAADRALFRVILGRAGYTVHEVARGRDVLDKARVVHPHIIILDVNLPDQNGLEVCRAIRADRDLASVPVLMLTVRHDDSDVLKGLEAGADDYVAKDSDPTIVIARVGRLIQFRQMSGLTMLNQQLVQVGRLVAGVVHEIRGPLSVIRGSSELLRINLAGDAENEQWIQSIVRNSQILQMRLDHLMATVRTGSTNVNLVDLNELAGETAGLFARGLSPSERGVEVETRLSEVDPLARCDAGRMMQVLLNLLNNARQAVLSARRRSGRVLVRTETVEREGENWALIEVIDDGPGIPESFLERVFEPFFTTRVDGTGYGLYLASEILKEQGGRLEARNNADSGATFTIWLRSAAGLEPLEPAAASAVE